MAAVALGQVVEGDDRLPLLAPVQVGLGDDPAETGIALGIPGQHDQVGAVRVGYAGTDTGRPRPGDGELGAEHGGQAEGPGRLGEADHAVEAVVVGQGEPRTGRAGPPRRPAPRDGWHRRGRRSWSGCAVRRRPCSVTARSSVGGFDPPAAPFDQQQVGCRSAITPAGARSAGGTSTTTARRTATGRPRRSPPTRGRFSTDSRPGGAVSRPRPETDTGSPPASTSSAGRGAGCTTDGAGGGDLTGPRGVEGGVGACLPGVPGDEAGPLGRPASPLEAGGHHAVRARGGSCTAARARPARASVSLTPPQNPDSPTASAAVVAAALALARARRRRPGGGRLARLAELPAPAPGHPVAGDPVGPEPAEHVGLGEGGEVTEGADAQPVQQFGQLGLAQDAHRKGARKSGVPPAGTMRPPRAASTAANSPSATPTSAAVTAEAASATKLDQRALAAEVAGRAAGGERADPRAHGGDPRAVGLHGLDHPGERAGGRPRPRPRRGGRGSARPAGGSSPAVPPGRQRPSPPGRQRPSSPAANGHPHRAATAIRPGGEGIHSWWCAGEGRRPPTGGGHRHPPSRQVALAGTGSLPAQARRCSGGCREGRATRPVPAPPPGRTGAPWPGPPACGPWPGGGGTGGQSTTRSTPSINAAVASAQAAPGRGTTARRARSIPTVVGGDRTQARPARPARTTSRPPMPRPGGPAPR